MSSHAIRRIRHEAAPDGVSLPVVVSSLFPCHVESLCRRNGCLCCLFVVRIDAVSINPLNALLIRLVAASKGLSASTSCCLRPVCTLPFKSSPSLTSLRFWFQSSGCLTSCTRFLKRSRQSGVLNLLAPHQKSSSLIDTVSFYIFCSNLLSLSLGACPINSTSYEYSQSDTLTEHTHRCVSWGYSMVILLVAANTSTGGGSLPSCAFNGCS